MTLKKKASKNIVGKGENVGFQNFLLFPQSFLLIHWQNLGLKSLLICRLQFGSLTFGSELNTFGSELNTFLGDRKTCVGP